MNDRLNDPFAPKASSPFEEESQPSYSYHFDEAPAGAQGKAQQRPSAIHIHIPQQKRSKVGMVLAFCVAVFLLIIVGSCAAFPFFLMEEATKSVSGTSVSLGHQGVTSGHNIAVFHMSEAISANSGTTPESIREKIQQVEEDPFIDALVVRVNCPGGTVAASEEIAQYFKKMEKPVVFSVSDLCASGAYMAASQVDKVVAMPTSQLGSIGVIMSTIDASELLNRWGIKMGAIKSAETKDTGAIYRSMTEAERERLQAEINELNEMFIDIVAEGRKLERDKVSEIADGSTYLGKKALDLGLIDELGTFDDALASAAKLAGISGDYGVVDIDNPLSFLNQVFNLKSQSTALDFVEALQHSKAGLRAE